MAKLTVDHLVELINEIEFSDSLDWGMLNVDEQLAVRLIANNILDQYQNEWSNLDDSSFRCAMLATIGHLVVENFILNLKVLQHDTKSN